MVNLERLLRLSLLLSLIGIVTGCATIFNSKSPPIEIFTTPPGASVTIGDGLVNCVTPCREPYKPELSLPITITLPGHSEYRGNISRTTSAYFWLNGLIFPSGLLGMGLDYLTGSMWQWENFSVIMAPLDGAESNPDNDEKNEKENPDESNVTSSPSKEASKDPSENPSKISSEATRDLDAKSSSLNKEGSKPWRATTNASPFPTEVRQDIPKKSSDKTNPDLLTPSGSSPEAKDHTAPMPPDRSNPIFPRQLVMRRLEWHMGALSEIELKTKVQCVYKILESHQGGTDLDLDMAIKMMIESHLDHCD